MMERDTLEELFDRLKNDFDVEAPPAKHQERFLDKLKKKENNREFPRPKKLGYLKPLLGIAASIAIIATVFYAFHLKEEHVGLASVSTEMAKTQHFYTTAIAAELRKIEKSQDAKTLPLVHDAMSQLQKLEKEYLQLEKDLRKSGNDNRVIFAMITNFQNRINVLQNVLEQIEHVKQIKKKENENPTII